MSRVITEDKRTGIKYVYEQVSVWSPEHKQARPKKTLIGKIDPATGEIVPTDGRGRKRRRKADDTPAATTEKPDAQVSVSDATDSDEMKKEVLRLQQELYLLGALVREQDQKIKKLSAENEKLTERLAEVTETINRLV